MFPRTLVPIPHLAQRQEGVILRSQALTTLSPTVLERLLAQQAWRTIAPGVYLTHTGPLSWLSQAWAGVLIGGPGAMLADDAAAYLWGLTPEAPRQIAVLLPHDIHPERQWPWRFRRTRNLPPQLGSPPRTPVPDTLIDLCLKYPDRQARILADAVSTGRATTRLILHAMDDRKRIRGRQRLEAMLGRVRDGIRSELELRYADDVERAHNLPMGVRQFYDGQFCTDVRYSRLIVELDGRLGHQGSRAFRDMIRDNAHALEGNRTLRFGWEDVDQRPCASAAQIVRMLRMLDEPVNPRPCLSCRADWANHLASA